MHTDDRFSGFRKYTFSNEIYTLFSEDVRIIQNILTNMFLWSFLTLTQIVNVYTYYIYSFAPVLNYLFNHQITKCNPHKHLTLHITAFKLEIFAKFVSYLWFFSVRITQGDSRLHDTRVNISLAHP